MPHNMWIYRFTVQISYLNATLIQVQWQFCLSSDISGQNEYEFSVIARCNSTCIEHELKWKPIACIVRRMKSLYIEDRTELRKRNPSSRERYRSITRETARARLVRGTEEERSRKINCFLPSQGPFAQLLRDCVRAKE